MTIVITGPGRRAPRQGAVFLLIIAVLVVAIGLILLGLAGDFLIDWLWFSATGYLRVFQAIIVAKALTFFVVFVATAIILWVNGSLARRFAQRPWTQRPADFEWKPAGRSEEHTSELQSHLNLVCRLLLEKKNKLIPYTQSTR